MRASWPLVAVAAACTLALGACSKVVDSADTPHDTGSTAEVVQPSADATSAQPGVGLNGGLGTSTATMGAAGASAPAVPPGSTNATPGSAVGGRP